jgi:hypothetical protein
VAIFRTASAASVPVGRASTDTLVPPDVPFPKYAVGLLQSESEMLQVPEHDLAAFLDGDPRWDVELYTERTVHMLLDSPDRVDCIVVGYNAAFKSAEIREGLRARPPAVGLCVLHQLTAEAFAFLPADDRLRFESLRPPVEPDVAGQIDFDEEVLLNWPNRVELSGTRLARSLAHGGVVPSSAGRWRTVLEASSPQRRVPVLLRSPTGRWPPLVVCTALLAPRHPSHAALIGNILLWCASGRPSAVVVAAPGHPEAAVMHRKLRLQGTRAIAERVDDAAELDFRRWPFRGVKDVLLPPGWDPTTAQGWPENDPHAVRPWLRGGGRIVVLGPGDSLTIRHAESDVHWVARRWAAWFLATPVETWCGGWGRGRDHPGSIVASRAVMTLLAALHDGAPAARALGLSGARRVLRDLEGRGAGIDPAQLGLPPLSTYAEPLRRLLERRIGDTDNVEGTVSATVAALDLDVLLGGAGLTQPTRDRMHDWLHARASLELDKAAALEDRLEIARCIGTSDSLREILAGAHADARLEDPLSAVLVTALRNAIAACDLEPGDPVFESLPPDQDSVVEGDLRTRPLLAARYLLGLSDIDACWSPDSVQASGEPLPAARAILEPPPTSIDRAVITIGRYGPLLRGWTDDAAPAAEMVSTEALALIAYFGRTPAPTHVIAGADLVAPATLTSVLREAEELRRENENLLRGERLLERVGPVAAAVAQVVVLIVVAALWWLVATQATIAVTWELGAAFVLWTLLTLAAFAWLKGVGLALGPADRLGDWLRGGIPGIRERLASRFHGDTGAP